MSAVHVLNNDGGISCGQRAIRGRVTADQYNHLLNNNKLRRQTKSSVNHHCDWREADRCFSLTKGKKDEVNCARERSEVSGFCSRCVSLN